MRFGLFSNQTERGLSGIAPFSSWGMEAVIYPGLPGSLQLFSSEKASPAREQLRGQWKDDV